MTTSYRDTTALYLNDLDWPDAEGVDREAWAHLEVTYRVTHGYEATYAEPGEPDAVEVLRVKVTHSSVPSDQWAALAAYIAKHFDEYLCDLVAEEIGLLN